MAEVRPIDANALYDQMTKGTKKYLVVEPGTKRIIEYGYHADDVLASIDQAPKLDYAPVRHGEWKYYHKKNRAVCTACSFERNLDDDFGRAISCPNCGAKMDGGKHD